MASPRLCKPETWPFLTPCDCYRMTAYSEPIDSGDLHWLFSAGSHNGMPPSSNSTTSKSAADHPIMWHLASAKPS